MISIKFNGEEGREELIDGVKQWVGKQFYNIKKEEGGVLSFPAGEEVIFEEIPREFEDLPQEEKDRFTIGGI